MKGVYNLLFQTRIPIGQTAWKPEMGSFYGLSAVDIDGKEFSFEQLQGRVSLIVNVACK